MSSSEAMRATELAHDRHIFVALVVHRTLSKLKMFVNTEKCTAFLKRIVDKALEGFDYDEKFCKNVQIVKDVARRLVAQMKLYFHKAALQILIELQDPIIEDFIAEWLRIKTRVAVENTRKMKTLKIFLVGLTCAVCLLALYIVNIIFLGNFIPVV